MGRVAEGWLGIEVPWAWGRMHFDETLPCDFPWLHFGHSYNTSNCVGTSSSQGCWLEPALCCWELRVAEGVNHKHLPRINALTCSCLACKGFGQLYFTHVLSCDAAACLKRQSYPSPLYFNEPQYLWDLSAWLASSIESSLVATFT